MSPPSAVQNAGQATGIITAVATPFTEPAQCSVMSIGRCAIQLPPLSVFANGFPLHITMNKQNLFKAAPGTTGIGVQTTAMAMLLFTQGSIGQAPALAAAAAGAAGKQKNYRSKIAAPPAGAGARTTAREMTFTTKRNTMKEAVLLQRALTTSRQAEMRGLFNSAPAHALEKQSAIARPMQ